AVEGEIRVFLQQPFVIGEKLHRVVRLQKIGLDRDIDLRFEQSHQFDFVPLRHREHFADGAAFNDLFNVPAGFFIGIEKDVRFGNAAEQIVKVAHDVLVSADHEDAEIINFAGNDAMKRERLAHILQIGELGNLAVGIAGNVNNRALSVRRSRQAMDWHDWKKLTERPVIEERLEDGKVADVLITQRCLQVFHFLGYKLQPAVHVRDLLGELPIEGVDLRFRFEFEQAEVERFLRFFLDLLDVVQTLNAIAALEPLFHIENVVNKFVIFLSRFDSDLRRGLLDRTECLDHEHRMMGDHGASAFIDDGGMRDAFGIAHVHDVPDDVVGVFLKRIIGGAVEIAAGTFAVKPDANTDHRFDPDFACGPNGLLELLQFLDDDNN